MIFCVVTYNQPLQLARLYRSLAESWGALNEDNFIIVNNHSNFSSPGPSRVFHNTLRPDNSVGYLSRSWNQCFIHGFGNSVSPRSEWVCLIQSDVVFEPNWREQFERFVALNGTQFLACGPGDQVIFMNIEAFRQIGWWDERFCGIGYQEFDYFARAYLRLGSRASIEGHFGSLAHNWGGLDLIKRQIEDGSGHTQAVNPTLFGHLNEKWSDEVCHYLETRDPERIARWREVISKAFTDRPIPKEYNWYPHFYMDDDRDYSAIYKIYTPLKKKNLGIPT